jgi:EAL domain-containing protein (putative c-di-GMP-specific phosphodiesterase class I)
VVKRPVVARAALDRALDEKEDLLLVYQPIHDARTGAIRAVEALMRQRRRSGELREASIISEAAERSHGGEIFMLDHVLIRKAYRDAAKWQARHPGIRLHVNLSPRELQEGEVVKRLTALLTSCGVDLHRVSLEITETVFIPKPEKTMAALEELKSLGIGLWLDDFGSGHSSLEHLQHFPLDGLKLPGSFVKPLPSDARCAAIVRHVIALAHDLDLDVVAEEVEREDQLEFLRELDCDSIQGFLYSKPMTAGKLHSTLAGGPSGQ